MSTTRKTSRRYLAYRAYCVVVIVAWNLAVMGTVPHQGRLDLVVLLIPLVVPAIFLVFSLMAFPFQFSVFGPLEGAHLPGSTTTVSVKGTSGSVGFLHATAPFFSWYLYPEGIGFRILGVGTGFVPAQQVTASKKRVFGGAYVYHTSPDVRSPLVIPSTLILEGLERVRATPTNPC